MTSGSSFTGSGDLFTDGIAADLYAASTPNFPLSVLVLRIQGLHVLKKDPWARQPSRELCRTSSTLSKPLDSSRNGIFTH